MKSNCTYKDLNGFRCATRHNGFIVHWKLKSWNNSQCDTHTMTQKKELLKNKKSFSYSVQSYKPLLTMILPYSWRILSMEHCCFMVFCGLLCCCGSCNFPVLSLENSPMYSSTNQIIMRVNERRVFFLWSSNTTFWYSLSRSMAGYTSQMIVQVGIARSANHQHFSLVGRSPSCPKADKYFSTYLTSCEVSELQNQN